MKTIRLLTISTVACLTLAARVHAGPITTPPPVITATGDVVAYFAFANAADTSLLAESSPASFPLIFCNHASPAPCSTANVAGDSMDLLSQAGPLVFSLENLTTSTTFSSNAPDSDGNYHVHISTNYSDFGVGALPAGVPSGPGVTYLAWEDLTAGQGSDFDYNDLIFAFTNTASTTSLPEPLTLSLMGCGLLGVGAFWARRKASRAQQS